MPPPSSVAEPLEDRRLMSVTVGFISPPSSVAEGASTGYYFTMTATAGETPVSWSIDWGDGTTPTSLGNSVNPNASHAYADGNAGRTITATCNFSYAGGGTSNAFATRSLTVTNVAPTWSLTGQDTYYATNEYTLESSDLYDPGQDTVTQWTVDWGDGSSPSTYSGSTTQYTHTFAVAGTYTLTTTAHDEDGSYSQTLTAVAIPGIAVIAFPDDITVTLGWSKPLTLTDDNGGSLATYSAVLVTAHAVGSTTPVGFFTITAGTPNAQGGLACTVTSAPAGAGGPTVGTD